MCTCTHEFQESDSRYVYTFIYYQEDKAYLYLVQSCSSSQISSVVIDFVYVPE
jgi:hypothetical protein